MTVLAVGQALVNIGYVTGLLPVTGIPLPFVSSGGTSLVLTMGVLGMLVSFARHEPDAVAGALGGGRTAAAAAAGAAGAAGPGPPAGRPIGRPAGRRPSPPAPGRPDRADRPARPARAGRPAAAAPHVAVVLAGGGTAGHIEPALAVADALRALDPAGITALGTERGLETTLVPARGYELQLIPPVPLPRRPTPIWLTLPARLRAAVKAAAGGAGPASGRTSSSASAATSRRRPTWPPAAPGPDRRARGQRPAGLANRLGARFTPLGVVTAAAAPPACAHAVTLGIPLRRRSPSWTGPPPRARRRAAFGLRRDRPTLLVIGGSQGARAHQRRGARGGRRPGRGAGVQVLHAAGPSNELAAPTSPAGARRTSLVPYLDRMDLAYAAADLVLCRSGAMTVAEITAVGLPAVYVPLPHGNGEQRLIRRADRRGRRRAAGRRRGLHPGVACRRRCSPTCRPRRRMDGMARRRPASAAGSADERAGRACVPADAGAPEGDRDWAGRARPRPRRDDPVRAEPSSAGCTSSASAAPG